MSRERYCIKRLYRTRGKYHHFDDTTQKDEWQLEVYLQALGLMKKYGMNSIIDIGCGSAYKLITYLGDYETIGIELLQTCEWLTEKYPDKNWLVSDFTIGKKLSADLIICADVIEHLVDPDELINFINDISFKYLIISTPSRNLLSRPWQKGFWGPPPNPVHIREWSFNEFHKYISIRFDIIDHRITNLAQATQMVICKSKRTKF
jgi:hypothetical protein